MSGYPADQAGQALGRLPGKSASPVAESRISSRESARFGLSAYGPDEGYFRFGLGGSLSYWLTPEESITGLAGVSQLTGDAEDSPIVDDIGDVTQAYVGAFIRYRF
ncbi:MipA/OmpV family protein [Modicisalibacter xianhensis]|uniref:MipA/OmpV family protein n=1 Tax=Modicisalibacter xianhensis TaxID=442341 RepID=UPI003BF5F62C